MRREERFVMSHRPYAVDLSSMQVVEEYTRPDRTTSYRAAISAVWFHRRRGETVACIGYLWDTQGERPRTGIEFLERNHDNRYGGDTAGRWNGEGYWGAEDPDLAARHLEILRPMLENYEQSKQAKRAPSAPDGYDGWWTFK